MRTMNLAVLGTAALALALGAGAAGAQTPGPEGPGGRVRGWDAPRAWRASSASARLRRSRCASSWRGGARSTRRCASRSRRTRSELKKALESASPVPAEVGELAIEGHRLREQGRALRAGAGQGRARVLTRSSRRSSTR